MQQYFINQKFIVGELYPLSTSISHHVKNVLKMSSNKEIKISNTNHLYLAEISYEKELVYAKITQELKAPFEFKVNVTLVLSMIKKERFQWALQKASELGVTKIIPLITDNCVVKTNDKIEKKVERWQTIVLEAAEQAKRLRYPEVIKPLTIKELKGHLEDQNFVAYEKVDRPLLKPEIISEDKSISILIGPEGGFSQRDLKHLNELNFEMCSLGPRILRSETAVVSALSIINLALYKEGL